MNTSFVKRETIEAETITEYALMNKVDSNLSKTNNRILNDSLNFNQSSSKVNISKKEEKSELRNSNLFKNLKLEDGL